MEENIKTGQTKVIILLCSCIIKKILDLEQTAELTHPCKYEALFSLGFTK